MLIKENYFSGNQESKGIKIYILCTCFSTLPKLKPFLLTKVGV
jgi:hypothetical protein